VAGGGVDDAVGGVEAGVEDGDVEAGNALGNQIRCSSRQQDLGEEDEGRLGCDVVVTVALQLTAGLCCPATIRLSLYTIE
jgi:hypothetical protein